LLRVQYCLQPRGIEGQHGERDATSVHAGQPIRAEAEQLLGECVKAPGIPGKGLGFGNGLLDAEMLFECDLIPHHAPLNLFQSRASAYTAMRARRSARNGSSTWCRVSPRTIVAR